MNKKVGISTSTIIHRSSLAKTDNKYRLNKEDKKQAKDVNKLRKLFKKNKYKCFSCRHSKNLMFCLRTSKDIVPCDDLCVCKYFSKL